MGAEVGFTTIKTLAVNAFVAWRISQKENVLTSREEFGDLEHFRDVLNGIQSLADFVFDVSRELLVYADAVERETTVPNIEIERVINDGRAMHLQALAQRRRGKRLLFFNSQDGVTLRLHLRPHLQRQTPGFLKYCCLCGTIGSRPRTTFRCITCDVPLCARIHPGQGKSCWSVWHEAERLTPREIQRHASVRRTGISLPNTRSQMQECSRNELRMALPLNNDAEEGRPSRRRRLERDALTGNTTVEQLDLETIDTINPSDDTGESHQQQTTSEHEASTTEMSFEMSEQVSRRRSARISRRQSR